MKKKDRVLGQLERAATLLEDARERRDDLIVLAVAVHPHSVVARYARLSRGRITQIVRARKEKRP